MVFYRLRFWAPLRCGELESQAIANELFDTGVNMGPVRAAKFMQRAYNRLKPEGWEALTEDGIIGAKSTAAINRMCRNYEAALHNYMNYLQAAEYDRLGMPDFLRGWFASRIQAI
jgi:lysozyme family protein